MSSGRLMMMMMLFDEDVSDDDDFLRNLKLEVFDIIVCFKFEDVQKLNSNCYDIHRCQVFSQSPT